MCTLVRVKLAEWAYSYGVHPNTAYRSLREGTVPVPARRRRMPTQRDARPPSLPLRARPGQPDAEHPREPRWPPRFAYNWGLALPKERLDKREQMRLSGLRELLSDDEVERLAPTVEVPWILPSLRKEWNRQQATVALWWAENSK